MVKDPGVLTLYPANPSGPISDGANTLKNFCFPIRIAKSSADFLPIFILVISLKL